MNSTTLKKSPLDALHREAGARMVPFAGWSMPVQYESGILEEHRAVRNAAGLFDVSHMGEISVRGPQATRFLDHLVTNHVAPVSTGGALYTLICRHDGSPIDDLILYRIGEEDYLLCVNAANTEADAAWILEQAEAYGDDVVARHTSADWAQLALQGPRAVEILSPLVDGSLPRRFRCGEMQVAGKASLVARTGYTGEDGFEIYCPPDSVESIARSLIERGQPLGLALCGLGARDSLRLEAGYPLFGHEIEPDISPFESDLGWVVKLRKPGFIGRDRLREQKKTATRKLIHFIVHGRRTARPETRVLRGDDDIGAVCSGTFSPIIGKPIGSAHIADDAPVTDLVVDIRGRREPIEVRKPPLHLQ